MANHHANYEAVISTPIEGVKLGINTSNGVLNNLDFINPRYPDYAPRDSFILQVIAQIGAYFRNPLYCFSLPFETHGTSFQVRVWRALQQIPSGNSWSYGQVASCLDTSPRAVGGACRANPLPIVIPCHRVVAATGIGGFSGQTVGDRVMIKQWLLSHENG
jgi:methylated-DNA-[protein]-cysteine S-methyltransferase